MEDDSNCVHNLAVSKEVKKRKMKIRTVKIFPICQIFVLLHSVKLSTRELIESRMFVLICAPLTVTELKNLILLF